MASRGPVDRRRLTAPEPTVQPVLAAHLRVPTDRPLLDGELARQDGRYPEQSRPYVVRKGIVSRAAGSAYVELGGGTKLTCAVYGPRSANARVAAAASRAYQTQGHVVCEVDFVPFATATRRPYQRSTEEAALGQTLQDALSPAIRRDLFPNAYLDIYVTVLEDDGSVLPAAILAASVAVAEAQVEMYDTPVACSALITAADAMVLVDPTREETERAGRAVAASGRAVFTCVLMPNLNRVTQVHAVGPLSASLHQETLSAMLDGCRTLYQTTLLPLLKAPSA